MFYRVYLIDDVDLVLKELEFGIPWNANGFEVVGRNTNPLLALEEIRELHPNVVFSDVMMPGLNGLDLIERIKNIYSDIEFVVVSAHSDFELVRRSLQLKVSDYLLKPPGKDETSKLLHDLWEKLNKNNRSPTSLYGYDGSNSKFNDILQYIEQNIAQKIDLASIRNQFFVSNNTICLYFSKYLNTTFVNYITDLRMRKAKQLISMGKPIKEVAALCGYDDYFYFFKVFQNYYHCTPTQMKKKEDSHENQ